MLIDFAFGFRGAFFWPLQAAIANLNDCLSGQQHLLGLIKAHVEELNEVVDRSIRESVDISHPVFTEGISLLGGDTFDCR